LIEYLSLKNGPPLQNHENKKPNDNDYHVKEENWKIFQTLKPGRNSQVF